MLKHVETCWRQTLRSPTPQFEPLWYDASTYHMLHDNESTTPFELHIHSLVI